MFDFKLNLREAQLYHHLTAQPTLDSSHSLSGRHLIENLCAPPVCVCVYVCVVCVCV